MTGPLLTAREVADVLGVSAETVLRWVRRGDLPAIRLPGGAIRFRGDDLDEWLQARAVRAGSRDTTVVGCHGYLHGCPAAVIRDMERMER